jgi:tRNA A-37 threonylcarbamoyl transferase component Bud32
MIDEIDEPETPVTIALRHLDDDLLKASIKKTLNRRELKYVSRRVLEALSVLHEDGYVHTGRARATSNLNTTDRMRRCKVG